MHITVGECQGKAQRWLVQWPFHVNDQYMAFHSTYLHYSDFILAFICLQHLESIIHSRNINFMSMLGSGDPELNK